MSETNTDIYYEKIPKHKFWRRGNKVFRFKQAWMPTINYYEEITETETFGTLVVGANILAGSEKISESEFNAVKEKHFFAHEASISE